MQTIFRESEAQTDPYSPETVLVDKENLPEVVMIQNLKFGSGLPACMQEMELIE